MKTVRIPDDWTGEEALMVAAFLEDVARTIWSRHRLEMGTVLQQRHDSVAQKKLTSDVQASSNYDDDDIPF